MLKRVKELSDISIKRLRHTVATGEKNPRLAGKPYRAMHSVGGVSGISLQCLPPQGTEKVGARSWLYRATIGKKVRSIGLGRYLNVPTKNAREAARQLQVSIRSGIDPLIEKKAVTAKLKAKQAKEATFEGFARSSYIPKEAKVYADRIADINQQVQTGDEHAR